MVEIKKRPHGRPTMTDDKIRKLMQIFAMDGTIKEACYYAKISVSTYYKWIENKPELKEEFDRLREKPVLKARQEVIKGLDNDKHFSLSYLKSKRPAEFGDTLKVENSDQLGATDGEFHEEDDDLRKELKERLRQNIHNRIIKNNQGKNVSTNKQINKQEKSAQTTEVKLQSERVEVKDGEGKK